jgi:hypothetical protein
VTCDRPSHCALFTNFDSKKKEILVQQNPQLRNFTKMDPENRTLTSPDVDKEEIDYVQHEKPARESHTFWYV